MGPILDLEDNSDEWEVQEIRDEKNIDGTLHYLVKWTGWPSEYDSCEPTNHLTNAPEMVKEFKKKRKLYKINEVDKNEDTTKRAKRNQ